MDEAIAFANGRTVNLNGTPTVLNMDGVTTTDMPMNPLQSLLHLISDPNIAFILFTLGFYGLLFELQSPNFVTGILGGIAIILAFIGFGSLPLNIAGLLLIGLGIILFILEFTVTSHGLLTIGGIVCFVLGAAALYTEPGTPTAPDVTVALPVLITDDAAEQPHRDRHRGRRRSNAQDAHRPGPDRRRAGPGRLWRGPPPSHAHWVGLCWGRGVDCQIRRRATARERHSGSCNQEGWPDARRRAIIRIDLTRANVKAGAPSPTVTHR